MKWVTLGALLMSLAGTSLALVAWNAADARDPIGPARVAVIDLERVFKSSARRTVLDKEIIAEIDLKNTAFKEQQAELKRLQAELDLRVQGTDEYKSLQKQILHGGADLQVGREEFLKSMEARRNAAFKEVLEEIEVRSAEYARQRDLDLILQKQLTVNPEAHPWKSVIYHRPSFDVTEDIIALVNGNR